MKQILDKPYDACQNPRLPDLGAPHRGGIHAQAALHGGGVFTVGHLARLHVSPVPAAWGPDLRGGESVAVVVGDARVPHGGVAEGCAEARVVP